jgi:hypothetical protein
MSKQTKKVRQDNYLRKLVYLRRMGVLPDGVAVVDIYHDGDCQHFQGRACNCNCDVRVRWVSPSAAQN